MHILMTYASQGILGGVETLMARMSRWLVRKTTAICFTAQCRGQTVEASRFLVVRRVEIDFNGQARLS